MNKITLNPIASGFNVSRINANFKKIEDLLNERAMFRDVLLGETNTVEADVDLNGNSLLNTNQVKAQQLFLNGQAVVAANLQNYSNRKVLVANGGAASYTLADDPGAIGNVNVFVAGVLQAPSTYSLVDNILTPVAPFTAGTNNVVIYYGTSLPSGATVNASEVPFVPSGGLVSTNVQDAIAEASGHTLNIISDIDIPVQNTAVGGLLRTQHAKNADDIDLRDFATQYPADSTTGIRNAIVAAAALKTNIRVAGHFLYSDTITVPHRIALIGVGALTDDADTRSPSCFIKNFDGTGFIFSGNGCSTDGIQYDSIVGKTGDNVAVQGSRFTAFSICATNSGNDGIRVGKTEGGASSVNANGWFIGELTALKNARHGLNVDHTNTSTFPNYPLGAPDCNAGICLMAKTGSDGQANGGNGINLGNTIDNLFLSVVSQHNTGYGAYLGPSARGNMFMKVYTEGNTTGDGYIAAGATQNIVYSASRAVTLSSGWNNQGGNSNLIIQHVSGAGQDGNFNSSPWLWGPEFYTYNQVVGGTAYVGGYVGASLVPAWMKIREGAGTGTQIVFATKRDGDTVTDKFIINEAGKVFWTQPLQGFYLGATTASPGIFSGAGTPEGVVVAPKGSCYFRTDGGAGTAFYVKESGVSSTGWVAK